MSLYIFVDPTRDKRKAHQLVPYEIKNSFQIILNEIKGITKSELFQKSASLFGIKSVNKELEKILEIAFNELIEDKQIYLENDLVRANT